MSPAVYTRKLSTSKHAFVVLSWLVLPLLGNLASCVLLAAFVEAFGRGHIPSFGVPQAFQGMVVVGTGTAVLVLPWLLGWAFRTGVAKRYGTCTLEGARATFNPPFERNASLPVGCLIEREVTAYGLRVRHPVLRSWLLIPTDGAGDAGRVAAELDVRAHAARKVVAPRGVGAPPCDSGLVLERAPETLTVRWNGGSLVLTAGELHLPRSGLGSAAQRFTPDALPFVYRGNQLTVWVLYLTGRRLLVSPNVISEAGAVWLQRLLQAWQQGALNLND